MTPGKDGGLWLWVLGLLLTGILVLGLGGVLAARFLAGNVEVIRTSTPSEEKRAPAAQPQGDTTGLPPFPGATLIEPSSPIELEGAEGDTVPLNTAKYKSLRPLQEIDDWYREKLGRDFVREGSGSMERKKEIIGVVVKSDDVAFISEKPDALLAVVLRKMQVGVEIVHLRVGDQPK
jgi:hypothetical protein